MTNFFADRVEWELRVADMTNMELLSMYRHAPHGLEDNIIKPTARLAEIILERMRRGHP